jgi:hypothetical protein
MAKKEITINELAAMVQEGFAGQERSFGKRFEGIEKDLKIIKAQLADAVPRSEFQKLEHRVDYLENTLNIKK